MPSKLLWRFGQLWRAAGVQALVLLCLFCFYLLMFLRYRPYEIDNPWFLSFSYNACVEHVNTDQFMEVKYPAGMDGTQYFGRIAAFVQCAALNRARWQQWNAEVLTASLVVAALGLWCFQLKRLGYGTRFVTVFLVGVGLSEPFLAAANRFRYESISFILLSIGLFLVGRGALFFGMVAGTLAIEVEPIALIGIIPLIVLAHATQRLGLREWLRLASGGVVCAGVYVFLHADLFRSTGQFDHLLHETGGEIGGFVAAYFKERKRHLPELVVIIIAAVEYWRRRETFNSHYAVVSAGLMLLFSFVVSHGNPAYMIFLYPFLVMTVLSAFQAEVRWKPIIAILLAYSLSQYAILSYINRGQGYRTEDIHKISEAIRSIADEQKIGDAKLRIYGDYGLWFAHPHYYTAASVRTLSSIRDADIYLCFDHPVQIAELQPESMLYCADIQQRVKLRLVRSVDIRSNTLHFYVAHNLDSEGP